jgi:hypothetical protein
MSDEVLKLEIVLRDEILDDTESYRRKVIPTSYAEMFAEAIPPRIGRVEYWDGNQHGEITLHVDGDWRLGDEKYEFLSVYPRDTSGVEDE